MINESPFLGGAEQGCWKYDAMEGHIILCHELVQFDIFRILPPLLPIFGIVACDGYVTDWSVKPHIHNFIFPSFKRYWCTPLQVASDASGLQTLTNPGFCD